MAELFRLASMTPDVSKAGFLERMLTNNTASYKYYWLRAILDEVKSGHSEITFTQLVARMVANAWYPVVYFHLYLGAGDRILDVIAYLQSFYRLSNDCPQEDIVELIVAECSSDRRLNRLVRDRTNNVPYRLIRPFYEYGIVRLRSEDPHWHDGKVDNAIFELNQRDSSDCVYAIWPDRLGLTLSESWMTFFKGNMPVIEGWLDYRLTQYLQARNPSVPAISLKIHPPVRRDLTAATAYWRHAIDLCKFDEIYSGRPFTAEMFDQLGSLSIDHFVPWSFVMHDEPWNLIPMFKNTNSSKSDKLPDLDRYMGPFCHQQFDAYLAMKNHDIPSAIRESYLQIDPHIDEYVNSEASREAFTQSLLKVVTPLYQIALNQGYAVWEYALPV